MAPAREWCIARKMNSPADHAAEALAAPTQHSSTPDRTGGIGPDRAGTSKISWIASFKPKSSWSEDNSFTTAGVYLSEHRLCSFTGGSFGSPFLPWGGAALSAQRSKGI